jgi:hypothetical protein
VLESGVVTEAREPRDVPYMELSRLFARRRHVESLLDLRPDKTAGPAPAPSLVPLRWPAWSKSSSFHALDLQPLAASATGLRAWSSLEARMAKYWEKVARNQWKETGEKLLLWQDPRIEIAGVEFQFPVVDGYVRPLVLTPESPEIQIPVGMECNRLQLLGQVTLPDGYPIEGEDGKQVASYILEYANGKTEEIPLRNGYEVVRSNLIRSATRLGIEGTEAQRALLFIKDTAREHYQVQLFSIPVKGGKLAKLRWKLSGGEEPIALFAVTAERFSRKS